MISGLQLYCSLRLLASPVLHPAQDDGNEMKTAKIFVLIHGAWQGAWVWQNVKAGLEKNGQKSYCS